MGEIKVNRRQKKIIDKVFKKAMKEYKSTMVKLGDG